MFLKVGAEDFLSFSKIFTVEQNASQNRPHRRIPGRWLTVIQRILSRDCLLQKIDRRFVVMSAAVYLGRQQIFMNLENGAYIVSWSYICSGGILAATSRNCFCSF